VEGAAWPISEATKEVRFPGLEKDEETKAGPGCARAEVVVAGPKGGREQEEEVAARAGPKVGWAAREEEAEEAGPKGCRPEVVVAEGVGP